MYKIIDPLNSESHMQRKEERSNAMRKRFGKLVKVMGIFLVGLALIHCNTLASEPPSSVNFNDGGNQSSSGAYYTFSYQLHRMGYDAVTETAEYRIGEYFTISGGGIPVYTDRVFLTNKNVTKQYVGDFSNKNGYHTSGTYTRDQWFYMNLVPGANTIIIEGQFSGNDSGDASYVINIPRMGHDPIVHGVNGTWIVGEVSSGKRTWESVYSDGAAGSSEGNKKPTSTGFTYTDVDEQPTPVGAYGSSKLSQTSHIDWIKNAAGNDVSFADLDKAGTYTLRSCVEDSAGNEACGTRKITVEQKKYSIKYNKNDTKASGTMANSTHTYDIAKKLTANAFLKTGYRFNKWNTKADGTGTAYTNEQSVKNLSSINGATVNLYAQWIPNTYTVKYHSNEGLGTMANSTHTYDAAKKLSKNVFTRNGWKFVGWNTKANGTGTRYTNEQSVKNLTSTHGATVNLYAQWNQAPTLSVKDHTYYDCEITQQQWLDSLRLKGTTAQDREDGNITSKIKVKSDIVEVDKPGVYLIVYEVTDSVGQTEVKSAKVTILYNHPPVITATSKVYHENELTAEEWQEEVMKDISAFDQEDGNVTDKIEVIKDSVKPSVPGCYEVTYKVTDSLGKTTQKTIDVTILENWEPVLQIFASNHRFIEGEYTQLQWENEIRRIGVSAHDKEDADLTDQVIVKKDTTNPLKHGIYEVTYKVTDRWGKSAEKIVKVIVEPNLPPEIFAHDKYFYVSDPITNEDLLKNVTAMDDREGDISADVEIISSTIEVGTVGDYEVTYHVSDHFGKTTEKTVKVHIRNDGSIPIPPKPPIPEDPDTLLLWNGRQLAHLTLTKEMEASLFDRNQAYKDVVFGVYAAEDIIYKGEIVLLKDSLVDIANVDETKQIHVTLYHKGKYYLKELKTNNRYQLDDNKYYFEF